MDIPGHLFGRNKWLRMVQSWAPSGRTIEFSSVLLLVVLVRVVLLLVVLLDVLHHRWLLLIYFG